MVRVKLTHALVADFVERQQPWIRIRTSAFDALITALVDDAIQLPLGGGNIN